MVSDSGITTRATYDPECWHEQLRHTHLEHLSRTGDAQVVRVARQPLPAPLALLDKAAYQEAQGMLDAATFTLCEAAVAMALVIGLLTRTICRGAWDAVARAGLTWADLPALRRCADDLADQLGRQGLPVAMPIDGVLGV